MLNDFCFEHFDIYMYQVPMIKDLMIYGPILRCLVTFINKYQDCYKTINLIYSFEIAIATSNIFKNMLSLKKDERD